MAKQNIFLQLFNLIQRDQPVFKGAKTGVDAVSHLALCQQAVNCLGRSLDSWDGIRSQAHSDFWVMGNCNDLIKRKCGSIDGEFVDQGVLSFA
jgi:hypothetical protein